MADISGLAVSTAALYTVCTYLYQQFTAEPMRNKTATYGTMLQLEALRFKIWGQSWDLSDDGLLATKLQAWGPDGPSMQDQIQTALKQIVKLFAQTTEFEKQYKTKILPELETLKTQQIRQSMKAWMEDIRNSVTSATNKFRWSIGDKARFQEMLQDLTSINNALESLLPPASNPRSFQYQMAASYSAHTLSPGNTADRDDDFQSLIRDWKSFGIRLDQLAEAAAQRAAPSGSEPVLRGLEHFERQLSNPTFPLDIHALSTLQINPDQIGPFENESTSDNRAFAKRGDKSFIVEFKPYSHSPDIRASIKYRVQALAFRMAQSPKPAGFSFLNCVGYYEDPSPETFRYNLIFEYPPGADPTCKPVSLYSVLSDSGKAFPLPSLEQRFKLAHALALGCLSLLLIEWVHKGLRPHNILLFYTGSKTGESTRLWLENPYIVGFDYSRPNPKDGNAEQISNETANPVPGHLPYKHPDTCLSSTLLVTRASSLTESWTVPRGAKPPFKEYYDIYSLGLILLEIGFWRPIAKLHKIDFESWDKGEFSKLEQTILSRLSGNELGHRMGSRYQDAVSECLQGPFVGAAGGTPDGNEKAWFWERVVAPLSHYSEVFGGGSLRK
jgi:Prion-inhibition and propagation